MHKLELALLILASFEISVGASYLIGKLSRSSVAKLLGGLATIAATILILRPVLESYPVSSGYRTWCGIAVFSCVALGIFGWIVLWVNGDFEGEGIWHKTSLLAGGIGLVSALSFIIVAIFVLARASRVFAVATVFIVFLVGSVVVLRKRHAYRYRSRLNPDYYLMALSWLFASIFWGYAFFQVRRYSIYVLMCLISSLVFVSLALQRTYNQLKYSNQERTHSQLKYPDRDKLVYYRSVLVTLSRIALVRVALLILIALPVFLISTEVGRLSISSALVIYVSLEVLVIDFQLRSVDQAVHLLSGFAS